MYIITVKLFCTIKNQFLKNLCSRTHRGGFQFLLVLYLWVIVCLSKSQVISFHAVIAFGLGKNILFKSILGHCVVVYRGSGNCHSDKFVAWKT